MNINKIIIGFAQSDKKYGLSKNKKFDEVAKSLFKLGIRSIDTAPKYLNSEKFVKKIN